MVNCHLKRALILTILAAAAVLTAGSSEALAGLGEPVSCDSMTRDERATLIDVLSGSGAISAANSALGKKRIHAILQRLPDRDLELLSENAEILAAGNNCMPHLSYLAAFLLLGILLLITLAIMQLSGVDLILWARSSAPRESVPQDERSAPDSSE